MLAIHFGRAVYDCDHDLPQRYPVDVFTDHPKDVWSKSYSAACIPYHEL